ncbi:MAG: M42 family metallopeptidase [Caldiserica bacterium]|nr:M42 family metallopeptidase [Caldisericota bacterium]
MEKKSLAFLEKLITLPSPSGYEIDVQRCIKKELSSITPRVETDVMGNVFGILNPDGVPRVMLAGHCDEIGLMVNFISEEGFIYFRSIGGIDPHLLPGRRVNIWGKKGVIKGVIGRKPIHLLEDEERKKVNKIGELFIDVGVKKKEELQDKVSIGDPVTFQEGLEFLNQEIAVARGFDDRIGAFMVVEVLRSLKGENFPASVYGVSTVQEEVGLRGARPSTFSIHPDVGICLEVGFATDFPGVDKKKTGEIKLGKGPIISRGPNINPALFDLLVKTAEEKKIPYQLSGEPRGTGTDANVMQLSREGVATCLISIPLRYMHTPVELLSLTDVENTTRLVKELILKITPEIRFSPV